VLILLPFVLIVVIIFAIDFIYFDEVKPKEEPAKQSIKKTDNRKNYIDKYMKK